MKALDLFEKSVDAGMYYQQFTRPGKTKLLDKPVDVWQELLIPDKDTEATYYEHKYWGEYAGITRHKYGKGIAIYIGCWCHKDILKSEVRTASELAGVKLEDFSLPVIIRSLKTRDGKNLHFVFNYQEDETTFSCPWDAVKDLVTGMHYVKGDSISLLDWGTAILIED